MGAGGRHLLRGNEIPELESSFDLSGRSSSFSTTASMAQRDEVGDLLELSDAHRRLANLTKIRVGGSYQGQCTTLCEPTGGILSVAGALSGQCDCVVWENDSTGEVSCKAGFSKTCCGSLDTHAGVVFYFAVVFYSFLGLAIICDNYFCESLTKLSAALGLSDDVAGATFMAAGSSAPELFTSLVTVLITGGSEGLGTIAGSAIFNMMIIVGVTALASVGSSGAEGVLRVWWYPLVRDSGVYFFTIIAMYGVMYDFLIEWWESLLLVVLYLGYVYIMSINAQLAASATAYDQRQAARKTSSTKKARGQQQKLSHVSRLPPGFSGHGMEMVGSHGGSSAGFNPGSLHALRNAAVSSEVGRVSTEDDQIAAMHLQRATAGNPLHQPAFRMAGAIGSRFGGGGWGGDATAGPGAELAARRAEEREAIARGLATAVSIRRATQVLMGVIGREAAWPQSKSSAKGTSSSSSSSGSAQGGFGFSADGFGHGSSGINSLEEEPPPTWLDRFAALLACPLEVLFAWTVPNCADPRWEQYYVATFSGSIAWIGLLSFVMCDFSTRAGCVLGIPGLLMGLVFLAAGTSVPDALSSVAVGRSGMGDMAVSKSKHSCDYAVEV